MEQEFACFKWNKPKSQWCQNICSMDKKKIINHHGVHNDCDIMVTIVGKRKLCGLCPSRATCNFDSGQKKK